ncbi:unnamed protein product, partial [Mesorhabditis spiculigera]
MFPAARMNSVLTAAVIDQLGIEELHKLRRVSKEFRSAVDERGLMPRKVKFMMIDARVPEMDEMAAKDEKIWLHETNMLIVDRQSGSFTACSYQNTISINSESARAFNAPFHRFIKLLPQIRSIEAVEMNVSTDYEPVDQLKQLLDCTDMWETWCGPPLPARRQEIAFSNDEWCLKTILRLAEIAFCLTRPSRPGLLHQIYIDLDMDNFNADAELVHFIVAFELEEMTESMAATDVAGAFWIFDK